MAGRKYADSPHTNAKTGIAAQGRSGALFLAPYEPSY